VLIDLEDGLSAAERAAVDRQVAETLQRNRNLCEDFVKIAHVRGQNFALCGEFELAPDADPAEVKAQILYQVQRYLAPAVASYSLDEMLEKKRADGTAYTVEEIFDGPALDSGFIPLEELARSELRTELRLSDIINIIMDIPGVRAVRQAVINRPGADDPPENAWLVPVSKGQKAQLEVDRCRLLLFKQELPVMANAARVADRYAGLLRADRLRTEARKRNDFAVPMGRHRDPGSYYPAQLHLPQVYGIGEAGLPAAADAARKLQARRLQAYLLFFEQLMANYLAQLANVRGLFSSEPGVLRTYYLQVIESLRSLYKGDPSTGLEQALEGEALQVARRNRFLDHLIARFGEDFATFAETMLAVFEISPRLLVRYRCAFLDSYPVISSERGLAYDYSAAGPADIWDSPNIAGLQKRLCKLLGISRCRRRNLQAVTYDEFAEVFTSAAGQIRFRIRDPGDGGILLRSTRDFATTDEAAAALRQAIQAASLPAGYLREQDAGGKFRFNVADAGGTLLALGTQLFESERQRDAAVEATMELLRNRYSDEGMFIIEHILLRREQPGDPLLAACPDPGCGDCAEVDPYSYRMQIVLPAFGARFGNMDFRRYAEQVIRAEVPAHILPKICWVDRESMESFEAAYQDWLKLKAGRTTADRAGKIGRLIRQMGKVKNVYPPERLHECAEGDARPKFIVGRRALGSMKPD
jgi:hypothetical protein